MILFYSGCIHKHCPEDVFKSISFMLNFREIDYGDRVGVKKDRIERRATNRFYRMAQRRKAK